MRIEFDAAKRTATLEARGLDMARAEEVLTGATLTAEDDRRRYGEERFITIGFSTTPWWSSLDSPQRSASDHQHEEGPMKGNEGSTGRGFDPDTAPDLSADGWPERFAQATVRRGRPPIANPKVSTTIRLSRDVVEHFKAGGRGWQTRVNDALREWIARHDTA